MPRTLDATLEAALDSGSFQPYFLLSVREVGSGVLETATPTKFKLSGINLTASWKRLEGSVYNGYTKPHELEFKVTRGVTIQGVNYTTDSSWYYGVTQNWDGKFQSVTACMLPETKYTAAGDVTYSALLDALCTNYDKTAVYRTPFSSWQVYKFLATGKILNLNKANGIINMLRQKYLIYACDNGNDEILFSAIGTEALGSASYTMDIGLFSKYSGDVSGYRRFMSRDEAGTVHYSGSADDPIWNLGYLQSAASAPTTKFSSELILSPIAPHLKYLTFDVFQFNFEKNYPQTPSMSGNFQLQVEEEYDYTFDELGWRINLQSFHWAKGTEGGALPGTIEQAAPYTPLNVSNFANTLSSTDNNIQAAMETIDDHDHDGIATTEGIQDIIGAMVSSNTETGIAVTYDDTNGKLDFDAQTAGDARYAPIAKGVTNGDTHDHVGGDGAVLPFLFPMATYINLNPITASNQAPYGGTVEATLTFVKWSMGFYTAGAAHDNSNYYTFTLKLRQGAAASDVTIATLDTKTLTSNNGVVFSTTTFSPTGVTGTGYLYIISTKTGAPADTYVLAPALRCKLT